MIDKSNIFDTIFSKNLLIRLIIFFVCCFIGTLTYNLFLVENNIVIGGMSGLAIIFKKLFNLDIPMFLNLSTIILVIISFIFLDIKKTIITLFGSVCYNYMVALTAPIASNITITFNSPLIMLLTVSIIYGICFGLIYRVGFNTGGSDTILVIMNKYLKIPMGLAGTWFNISIVIFGLIVFGPTNTVYAVFILILNNKITDAVTLGIRDSKMCFIKSKKSDKIEHILLKEYNIGVTKIATKGGIFTKREDLLLIIIPTEDYYGLKHLIKTFDNESFIMTSDCYTVTGGYKKQIIPF